MLPSDWLLAVWFATWAERPVFGSLGDVWGMCAPPTTFVANVAGLFDPSRMERDNETLPGIKINLYGARIGKRKSRLLAARGQRG